MQDFLYVKVLLYAYPKLSMLEEAISSGAEVKALLSFRAQCDAFTLAEKIADDILMARRLGALREMLDEALEECTEEERFLFEYKYFRRRSELCGRFAEKRSLACSKRNYFRKQNAAFRKMTALLLCRGYTKERFILEFGGFSPFRRVYRALKKGRERLLVAKRRRSGLVFAQNSSEPERGAGLLPLRTRATIAINANPAAQITITCRAEGKEEGSSSGGGSAVSLPDADCK